MPTVSAHWSRPCIGILALCGYIYMSYIASLHSTICVIFLLCLSFCHYPYTPLPPTPLYKPAQSILMNPMKKSLNTGKNQPLSTYQVSCTKANR